MPPFNEKLIVLEMLKYICANVLLMTQIYTKTLHVQKLYFRIFEIYIKGHLNQSNRKKYQTSEFLLVLPVGLACFKKMALYSIMLWHFI